MKKIFEDIEAERRHQDMVWGGPEHDDEHREEDWIDFIINFAEGNRGAKHGFRGRMVRVAALAVAAIQAYDRGAFLNQL